MFANAQPIAQSSLTAVIDAPVGQVWKLIRDFGRVADWHPVLSSSAIEAEHVFRSVVFAGSPELTA